MPTYRFTGKVPMHYGARKVSAGDLIELPAAPNRLFVLVESPVDHPPSPAASFPEDEGGRGRKFKKEN